MNLSAEEIAQLKQAKFIQLLVLTDICLLMTKNLLFLSQLFSIPNLLSLAPQNVFGPQTHQPQQVQSRTKGNFFFVLSYSLP